MTPPSRPRTFLWRFLVTPLKTPSSSTRISPARGWLRFRKGVLAHARALSDFYSSYLFRKRIKFFLYMYRIGASVLPFLSFMFHRWQ